MTNARTNERPNERTNERTGEHMAGNEAAELYWAVLDAGVVRRLDLLNEALEQARRDGAATALQTVADELEQLQSADAATYLRLRANAHLADQQ